MNDELRRASERAVRYPYFLARTLASYRLHQNMSEADMARFLNCLPQDLPKLGLCRRPDAESSSFRADVEKIARVFGLLSTRLVQIIRETDALEELGRLSHEFGASTAEGLMMAARDATSDGASKTEVTKEGDGSGDHEGSIE